MKILAWIFGVLLVICGMIYTLIFTSLGNAILAPRIEAFVSEKIAMPFKLNEFKLGFNNLKISSTINGELSISTSGKYSILDKNLDLKYKIYANSFSSMPLNLNIAGDVKGSFENILANGSGNLAGSKLRYAVRIVDFNPLELKLDARNLDLAQLSLIALKKPYLRGFASITADVALKNGTQFGFANINAPKISADNALINKDYGIKLPKNFNANLNSDISVNNSILTAITTLNTSLANANAQKTSYNLKTNELNTDFNLDIANLANLEPLISQKLNGSVKIALNTQIKNNKMQFLDAQINGLGGNIMAKLVNGELNAQIKDIKLAEALSLASLPPLAKSQINGFAKITGLNNPQNANGNASLKFSKGELDYKQMNKILNSDLKSNIIFTGDTKISVLSGVLNLDALLDSPALKMAKLSAKYELNTASGDADFNANIPNLGLIFGSKAKTSAYIKANTNFKNNAIAKANIDINGLGGNINATLNNQSLQANINNIQAGNVFAIIAQDELFSGSLNANINLSSLDITKLNGQGQISLNNAVFNAPNLSKMLDVKFPQNSKFNLNAKVSFKDSLAKFNALFNSDLAKLDELNGIYDLKQNALNADFKASVANLANLAFLSGASINAPLNANGKVSMVNGALNAKINSDIFGSQTSANYANDTLNASMQKVKIENILSALGYDKFYLGLANTNFKYNLKNAVGEFDADVLEGKLAQNGLTQLINAVFKRDITNEVYENGKVYGTINKNYITLNAKISSPKSNISIEKGTINSATKTLNIPLKANFEKTDLSINITGTTDKPKYNVKSDYLQEKVINKAFDKLIKNDEKRENTKQILNDLKGLF
ncbi:MAG: hypothetical protein CGEMS_1325 [Candidatus Campylobacter infans]|nr:MAG: hypothetical protein CGEMS_1325 [Candidatus Campylobacter infans]